KRRVHSPLAGVPTRRECRAFCGLSVHYCLEQQRANFGRINHRGERRNPSAPLRTGLAQGTQPRYATSGHLLYAQGGTLMAAPFDERQLALTSPAVPALEGVAQSTATGAAQYSVSSTGTLVYLAGGL